MVTARELKSLLDEHLSKLVWAEGDSKDKGFLIYVSREHYTKAKYSCTEDEKEFSLYKGRVFYKGFELISRQW